MARTVLVVDDSPTMRGLVGATLKAIGFSVVEAGNGKEALDAADRAASLDLVITDLNMPIMDGIAFVRQLRTRAKMKYTPVLLLTTETSTEQKDKAKSAGATGWLTKPFDPKQLVATVQRVLP
jgi:two-component system chemotaxis response regulator CheY